MKRLINLYNIKNKTSINGFTNVEINNLTDIINYSADHIFCGCLEYLEQDKIEQTILSILEKIRPQGYCVLSFMDMKQACRLYYQNSLSDPDLLALIKDHKSIVSYQSVCDLIKKIDKFNIIQTDFIDRNINIVIQRTQA